MSSRVGRISPFYNPDIPWLWLTSKKERYSPGVWSPDGARIAYPAGHLGDTVYEKAASGLGDARVLFRRASGRSRRTTATGQSGASTERWS